MLKSDILERKEKSSISTKRKRKKMVKVESNVGEGTGTILSNKREERQQKKMAEKDILLVLL